MKNDFSFQKAAKNGTTQTTLAFEEVAKSYPFITFIHKYPGFVNTGVIERFMDTATGLLAVPLQLAKYLVMPFLNLFSYTIEEAGERGVFLATSARYPPAKPKTEYVGQALPAGVHVAQSSIVKDGEGNGVYRVGAEDDSADESPALINYRAEDVGKTIWEETQAVWDRALERSA